MLRLIFPPLSLSLRRHDPFDVLEAIFFIVYTGCEWSRLPMDYPPYQTVYYHYRCWSAKGYLTQTLRTLVLMKRHRSGQPMFPTVTVIDSQSVRTVLPHAVSGIDGGKLMAEAGGIPAVDHMFDSFDVFFSEILHTRGVESL